MMKTVLDFLFSDANLIFISIYAGVFFFVVTIWIITREKNRTQMLSAIGMLTTFIAGAMVAIGIVKREDGKRK